MSHLNLGLMCSEANCKVNHSSTGSAVACSFVPISWSPTLQWRSSTSLSDMLSHARSSTSCVHENFSSALSSALRVSCRALRVSCRALQVSCRALRVSCSYRCSSPRCCPVSSELRSPETRSWRGPSKQRRPTTTTSTSSSRRPSTGRPRL